jgi:mRNA interferase MazF
MTPPMRGQVFRVDLGHGAKPWVIVSNIQRNRNLQTVIAARITTTRKNAELPTIVELSNDDPLVGFVCVTTWYRSIATSSTTWPVLSPSTQ